VSQTEWIPQAKSEEAMPDRDVKTIRDLIYYQYAKTIARSAFGARILRKVQTFHSWELLMSLFCMIMPIKVGISSSTGRNQF